MHHAVKGCVAGKTGDFEGYFGSFKVIRFKNLEGKLTKGLLIPPGFVEVCNIKGTTGVQLNRHNTEGN